MSEQVNLQFTQDDRDLLQGIAKDVKFMAAAQSRQGRRLNSHGRRLRDLEAMRDQGKGAALAFRWVWAAVLAIGGLLGWHMRQH